MLNSTAALFRVCEFSEDRRHRYTLWREWDMFNGRIFNTLCLNPSTADETVEDPTVRRCIGYAKALGYGAFCMTNLFGYRATDPADMKRQADPVGKDNDRWIIEVAKAAHMTVAAWGTHGEFLGREKQVIEMFRRDGLKLHCFRLTNGGKPSHPLYLPANLRPTPFPPVA